VAVTLFEILLKKTGIKPDVIHEKTVFNPLDCLIGTSVTLDIIDHRGIQYRVCEIRENTVGIDGKPLVFVDYALIQPGQSTPEVRLRLIPNGQSFNVLLINETDCFCYDESLHNAVQCSSGQLNIGDDSYWRIGDVKTGYESKIKLLSDENMDGRVDVSEVRSLDIEYWDYSRMTPIDGVDTEQYLAVEMDKDHGGFQIWQGTNVDASKIEVF
jgi:hypothetical protein